MTTRSQLWFVFPHLLACACFAAAFYWMSVVGNNRSKPDLYLAIGGFAATVVALAATVGVAVIVIRRYRGRGWPWLGLHAAGLAGALALANAWMAAHIA